MPNPQNVTVSLTNLIPNEKYSYEFKGVSSNWPITITPISGTFLSAGTNGAISAMAYFCVSRSGCDPNYNGYIPCTEHFCTIGNDYFSNIILEFKSVKNPTKIYQSPTLRINSGDSLPKAEIIADKINIKKDEQVNLNIKFKNLSSQKTYRYSIESLSANWPFVVSSPSGFFHSGTGVVSVDVKGGFCANTGVCGNNKYGVLNWNTTNHPKLSWYNPQATIRLSYFDVDYPNSINTSNITKFNCTDCDIPMAKTATIELLKPSTT